MWIKVCNVNFERKGKTQSYWCHSVVRIIKTAYVWIQSIQHVDNSTRFPRITDCLLDLSEVSVPDR